MTLSQEQINVDLFDEVKRLQKEIETLAMVAGDSENELVKLRDKYKRLIEVHKELVIQENAMQAHYQLAFKSMQKYKKCCDDITAAMNTERPAEEKTKEVRRILEQSK
ncbi:hypothetical protein [Sporosarcina sp. FSL K6-2383]|uniref:hypothetical protein n=1 Tax=Sporosarcina sp. FSL K6-2383 TaxID=2921556 RepID=UPI00315A31B8